MAIHASLVSDLVWHLRVVMGNLGYCSDFDEDLMVLGALGFRRIYIHTRERTESYYAVGYKEHDVGERQE
jgi:hypothetical protein